MSQHHSTLPGSQREECKPYSSSFNFGLEPDNFFVKTTNCGDEHTPDYAEYSPPKAVTTNEDDNNLDKEQPICVNLDDSCQLSSWINSDNTSTDQHLISTETGKQYLVRSTKRQKTSGEIAEKGRMDFYLKKLEKDDVSSNLTVRENLFGPQSDEEFREMNFTIEEEKRRQKVMMFDEELWRYNDRQTQIESVRSYGQQLYKSASKPANSLAQLYNKPTSKSLGGVVKHGHFKVPVAEATVIRAQNDNDNNYNKRLTKNHCFDNRLFNNDDNVSLHDEESKKPNFDDASCRSSSMNTTNAMESSESKDLISLIEREILEVKFTVSWDDVCGLSKEKSVIKEMIIWPMLRPDLFHGIRAPPKGLLLYGPPGTGKTMIGRCIASQTKATFFNVGASSLASKWMGESEKLVRALFETARRRSPSVVFIDEVDSLLSQRQDNEQDAIRRIKNELLQQLDGLKSDVEDKILVIGATNRPHELDAAARRRFPRRLYIPLPDELAREQILSRVLADQKHEISLQQIKLIAQLTENFSCADMVSLCREASFEPLRKVDNIETITCDEISPINYSHFDIALSVVKPSVSEKDVLILKSFHDDFGYNQ